MGVSTFRCNDHLILPDVELALLVEPILKLLPNAPAHKRSEFIVTGVVNVASVGVNVPAIVSCLPTIAVVIAEVIYVDAPP